MLGMLLKIGKYANFVTLAAQLLNNATDAFPALKLNPTVILIQGILAALTSSVFGLGHKAEFSEAQTPGDRTTAEVISSAVAATETLKAATPAGQSVAVPKVASNVVAGTGKAA